LDFKAKKIWFIETEFFMKDKTRNSGGEKEPQEARREIFFGLALIAISDAQL
jgi:hypothetical protein